VASSGSSRVPEVITDRVTGRRIDLYATQARNRRLSWLLFLLLAGLLALVAWLLALAFDPAGAVWFVGVALAVAGVQSAVAWAYSDRIALAAAGARRASREEQRYLVNVSEAVALGAGVPTPRVFVIDDPSPNAFATGRDPRHAAVAVTRGMLEMLDRQELEGVVAHEMAHIRNFDIRFMSFLAATVGAIVVVRDLVWRWMRFGRRRSAGGGGRGQALAFVLVLVLVVVAPIMGTLLRLAVSRRREYLADATGAYITRNPEGLARALEKLRDFRGAPLEVSEGVRHMFFVNPLAKRNAFGWWATHPPIDDRIDRLRRM
jgi:heat shock protein HtpX